MYRANDLHSRKINSHLLNPPAGCLCIAQIMTLTENNKSNITQSCYKRALYVRVRPASISVIMTEPMIV